MAERSAPQRLAGRRSVPTRAVVAAATGLALLAGCAGVPADGRVVPVETPAAAGDGAIQIAVGPPKDGARPGAIVQGFLDAMSSSDIVAQDYLAVSVRDDWSRGEIVVYEDDRVTEAPDADDENSTNVSFSAVSVATIDAQGHYRETPELPEIDEPIRLVRDPDDGLEWRIADPPVAYLISSFDLDTRFGSYDTYFVSPARDALVVEPVWLPSSPEQLVGLLAQAVVDGPTLALGPSVLPTFPPDTVVSDVTVEGDRVEVALSGALDDVAPQTVDLMALQLAETLGSTLGSVNVDLTVGGRPLEGTGRPVGDLSPLRDLGEPSAYAITDTGVRAIGADGGLSQVPGPLGRNEVAGDLLAVSYDEQQAAMVLGGTVVVAPLSDDSPPQTIYQGASVTTPSWDRFGRLWVVDRQQPGLISRVRAFVPDQEDTPSQSPSPSPSPSPVAPAPPPVFTRVDVVAPDLDNERVETFRVAPDGVRVAVVSTGTDQPSRLRVGYLLGGSDGSLSVELPAEVALVGSVLDVAWAGPSELVVVLQPPGSQAEAWRVSVDGATVNRLDLRDVTRITAYPTRQPLVISAAGNILRLASVATWVRVGPGRAVAYPG